MDLSPAGETPLVVVLGASGLLGTAVAKQFADRPVRLRLVGRRPAAVMGDRVEVCTVDLTEPGAIGRAVWGADVVIHLVAQMTGPAAWRVMDGDRAAERVNVGLVHDLIDAIRLQHREKSPVVVFAGAVSQAGRALVNRVDGTEPDEPVTAYDRHKLAAEHALNAATEEGVLRGITLRMTTLFGRSVDDPGVVGTMMRRAFDDQPLTMWHDGTVRRDLLGVDDAARAFVAACDNADELAGRHWVIGTGESVRIGELFGAIADAVSKCAGKPAVPVVSVPPVEHSVATDVLDFVLDPSPFRAVTGWSASTAWWEAMRAIARSRTCGDEPMRVLFATYSEKTHFLGMVPLAWALRTAGHEVRVASQPELTDVITQAGLTAVPVGEDHTLWQAAKRFLTPRFKELNPEFYEETRRGQSPPFDLPHNRSDITWEYLRDADEGIVAVAEMVNRSMLDDLVEFARDWKPDLVIWEPATYGGAIAAQAVGAAHARMPWGLDFAGALRGHFLRLRDDQPDMLAGWLAANVQKYGGEYAEHMTTGHFTINYLPPSLSLGADVDQVPLRFVPYGGPAVVPNWLWAPPDRPRIALTLGLSATERFDGYLVGVQEILEALSDVDAEVVATVADKERHKVGTVPPNARIVSYVPLHALLPTCDAVIHHGGAGTVSTATLYGVPQLILPDQADGQRAALLLTEQRAALTVQPDVATGEIVRENLLRLIGEPVFRENADRLRAEALDLPVPNDVVGRLVELTARHRG